MALGVHFAALSNGEALIEDNIVGRSRVFTRADGTDYVDGVNFPIQ
jgi:hypothetical protein